MDAPSAPAPVTVSPIIESAATVCSSAESDVCDWTAVSWAISVMNEVGSVGSVGSWFSNWATRSWRNVWELSSWFKPLALDVVVVEPVGPVVLVVDVGTDDVVVVLAGVVEVDEVHCVVDVVEGVELVVVVVVGELVEGLVEVEVLDVLVAAALTGVSDCAVVTKLPNAGISGSTTSSKFPVRDGTRSLVASVDRKAKSCPTPVVPA